MAGRPSKLTDEVIGLIVDALAVSASRQMAAAYGGITYQTFYIWEREARVARDKKSRLTKHKKLLINFLNQVEQIEAQKVVEWSQVVDTAAKKDPLWADKMLQRRDPGYMKTPAAPIDLTKLGLSLEQLLRIAAGEDIEIVLASPGPGDGTGPDNAGCPRESKTSPN